MKTRLAAGALALMALGNLAQAEVTVTPAIVSDYDFRGISLSAKDPALQVGVDFTNESFWTFSLWGSQTDLGPAVDTDIEIDATIAFAGGSDETVNWGAGLTYYTYVSESDLNYPEIYVGVSRPFTEKFSGGLKLWYSNDYGALNESATYLEANARVELPSDFGLEFHVGRSQGGYWDTFYGDGYTDFSVGVTKSIGGFNLALRYIDGSDLPDLDGTPGIDNNLFSTDEKVMLSISRSFSFGGKSE